MSETIKATAYGLVELEDGVNSFVAFDDIVYLTTDDDFKQWLEEVTGNGRTYSSIVGEYEQTEWQLMGDYTVYVWEVISIDVEVG